MNSLINIKAIQYIYMGSKVYLYLCHHFSLAQLVFKKNLCQSLLNKPQTKLDHEAHLTEKSFTPDFVSCR